jgi:cellulose synthase/poly-beta-1,6-N-acetylglucosamine synthase-like glycosyltransferase
VVVFDAEDIPAPNQLRDAAAIFAASPDIACLQARLVIHNVARSWLTAAFAIEYSALFDVVNPGLAALGAPIALGGTSNHFRTVALRRAGAWDAWNLTEDADLGIRLARFGARVATFDSDTYEEAPASFSAWLGQRRRWQQGWLQTTLVHSRNPVRIVRELGAARAFGVFGLIGGAVFGGLLGPFLTALTLWRAAFDDLLAPATPFESFVGIMTIEMLLGGFAAILIPAILGLRERRLTRFAWTLTLLPVYYCLISIATWLAVCDLFWHPFFWRKTQHGVGRHRHPTGLEAGASD